MIAFSSTVDDMIERLRSFKEVGATRVGVFWSKEEGRELLDNLVQLELVYVDADGRVVGDEANDYQPKAGEVAVVKIS